EAELGGQQRGSMKTLIVRPGVVVGAGGDPRHWGVGAWPFPSVCRVWGHGRSPLPFVLVDDCAAAMAAMVAAEDDWPSSFNLVGDVRLTANEYLDELERASGATIRRVHVSPARLVVE